MVLVSRLRRVAAETIQAVLDRLIPYREAIRLQRSRIAGYSSEYDDMRRYLEDELTVWGETFTPTVD